MRAASYILIALAVAGGAFSWWGLCTVAGRTAYDEMAGLIPFYAGIASVVLAIPAAITYYLSTR